MSLLTRTAVLQARVSPEIKIASEHVLRRIGLTMTEAMELFLRRIIVDEKLPFEVAALDDAALATIVGAWNADKEGKEKIINLGGARSKSQRRQKRE
jgi:addiction module RelB/DinJ family antitoxin